MDTVKKIDFILNEYGVFGKEKSKTWKKIKEKILKSKKAQEIKKILDNLPTLMKKGEISMGEFQDLISKADYRYVKLLK